MKNSKKLNSYKLQQNNVPLSVDYKLSFGDESRLSIRYQNKQGKTEYDLFYFDDHAQILDAYYEVKKKIEVA